LHILDNYYNIDASNIATVLTWFSISVLQEQKRKKIFTQGMSKMHKICFNFVPTVFFSLLTRRIAAHNIHFFAMQSTETRFASSGDINALEFSYTGTISLSSVFLQFIVSNGRTRETEATDDDNSVTEKRQQFTFTFALNHKSQDFKRHSRAQ
jgi:hypothetical protein